MRYRIDVFKHRGEPNIRIVGPDFGIILWLHILNGELHGSITAWCPAITSGNTSAQLMEFQARTLLRDLLGPLDFAPKAMQEAA